MNRRVLLWIAAGVIAVHGLVFWLIGNSSPLPKRTFVPPPNFRAREKDFIDPETGGKIQVQEFTVSTKLGDSERLP